MKNICIIHKNCRFTNYVTVKDKLRRLWFLQNILKMYVYSLAYDSTDEIYLWYNIVKYLP